MKQEKIGKFIAECRKGKGLTQMQLAEKLSITNRAVSKWENGNSFPDASILVELCEELGITLNELFSGEKIKTEEYQMKAETNFIELFKNGSNKKKLTLIMIVGELLIVSGIVMLFSFPDVLKLDMTQNIIMRAIGIFVFGCGTTVSYYSRKIKNAITI